MLFLYLSRRLEIEESLRLYLLTKENVSMKIRTLLGWLLLATACIVISGICIGNLMYWSVIDVLVIVVCATCGLILLYRKKQMD
jgi:hypothetical protein